MNKINENEYKKLKNTINNLIDFFKESLDKELSTHGVKGTVSGRLKHTFSIYKKMEENDIDFDRQVVRISKNWISTKKDGYTLKKTTKAHNKR